jgi:hypothetical protein
MHIAHTHNLRSKILQLVIEIVQFNKTDLSLSCLFNGVLYSMYDYMYNFLGTLVNDVCISTYISPISCLPEDSQTKRFFSGLKKQKNFFFPSVRFLIIVSDTKSIRMLLINIVFLAQKRTLGEENPPEAVGLKISFKTCTRKNILNRYFVFSCTVRIDTIQYIQYNNKRVSHFLSI